MEKYKKDIGFLRIGSRLGYAQVGIVSPIARLVNGEAQKCLPATCGC